MDSGGAGARCSSLTGRAAAGNWRIRGGTLRASPHFPSARFLIEVGTDTCTPKDHQKVCSEFVGMDNIFLDGGHSAAGCLKVSLTMCARRPSPPLFSCPTSGTAIRITPTRSHQKADKPHSPKPKRHFNQNGHPIQSS